MYSFMFFRFCLFLNLSFNLNLTSFSAKCDLRPLYYFIFILDYTGDLLSFSGAVDPPLPLPDDCLSLYESISRYLLLVLIFNSFELSKDKLPSSLFFILCFSNFCFFLKFLFDCFIMQYLCIKYTMYAFSKVQMHHSGPILYLTIIIGMESDSLPIMKLSNRITVKYNTNVGKLTRQNYC